jgi:HlyD family secretion protein
VVSVDDEENKDGALRPYMTANLTFVVGVRENALMVPNAALRWQPARNQIAPDVAGDYAKLRGKKRAPNDPEAQDRGIVWVKDDDGHVRFIEIRTGLSDSVNTEILGTASGGELAEGTQIVVGETRAGAAPNNEANPFIARPFGPKKKE